MMAKYVVILFLLVGAYQAQILTNILVSRFDLCGSDNWSKFFGNITTKDAKQYLDFDITLPTPLDDNVGVFCVMESILNSKVSIPLVTIREKNVCLAGNKYLGEFWYDMERAAQILPVGSCPIRAGHYHVHQFYLNFDKVSLRAIPFGKIRVQLTAIDKRTNRHLLCLKIEAENFKM